MAMTVRSRGAGGQRGNLTPKLLKVIRQKCNKKAKYLNMRGNFRALAPQTFLTRPLLPTEYCHICPLTILGGKNLGGKTKVTDFQLTERHFS